MYRLTKEQADILKGEFYDVDTLFNPVQDINGNWFISKDELKFNKNLKFKDLLDKLSKEDFIPPESPILF